MSFPVYKEYRRTEHGTKEPIPAHWSQQKVKYLAKLQSGEFITSESIESEGEFPIYGGNGLRGYSREYTHDGEYALIGRQGALCGNIQYGSGKFWASEHAIVAHPKKKFHTKWFGELLRSMNLNQYSVSAAQPGLSVESISNLYLCVPTSDEQEGIAKFIEREAAKIDALVSEQENLIALLQEKRQALISHAVTKGLDPKAPMKDSGIEWIGEIPDHWNLLSIKHLWKSSDYGISDSLKNGGSIRVLTMGNIKDGYIDIPDEGQIEYVEDALLLKPGDLLFNRTNSLSQVAKVGILENHLDSRITFASYLVRFRTTPRHHPKFWSYSLNHPSLLQMARSMAFPSINQANLNPNRYGTIQVAVPPFQEQEAIAHEIDRQMKVSNELLNSSLLAVTLLKERRAALITAAVTGKIDVRSLA